jgi:hypothetical protein
VHLVGFHYKNYSKIHMSPSPPPDRCWHPQNLLCKEQVSLTIHFSPKAEFKDKWSYTSILVGGDSVVVIATRYEVDGQGIKSWWGRDFPHMGTGIHQPPVQWVPGFYEK